MTYIPLQIQILYRSRAVVRKGLSNGSLIAALFLVLHILASGRIVQAQAIPAAEASPISTGFTLPRVAGSLAYSVSANESISSGYYGTNSVDSSTGLTGNVAYISPSTVYPFSMVFSGGRSWTTSGQPSTLYLNLGLSQVINTRNWTFVLSDSVSYLPQTPSTGLSGIPGTGDLGIAPVQIGVDAGQGVLTGYSNRVGNVASLNTQRKLTGKTSLNIDGTYTTLRFLGDTISSTNNGGLNNDGASGTIGLTHRIDARNNINGNYAYSRYSYGPGQPGVVSQTASIGYTHDFSRRLNMDLSAGPQWTRTTGATQNTPESINLFTSAALNYTAQLANFSLAYSRGTNSGSGVVQGARSDSVNFRASRGFDRIWSASFNSSYTRTTSLSTTGAGFAPQTLVDSFQLSRALGRSLSAYASYTLENQSAPGSAIGVNVFSGFFQIASFGLTYSPN